MEKREEILLCISRLASIGAEAGSDAGVMCNAIEYLTEYMNVLKEKESGNLEM